MTTDFSRIRQPEFNTLISRIHHHCHNRSPEALDLIFDALPQNDEALSCQIISAIVAQLGNDLDSLSWLCGYMASEISCSEDNQRPHLPLVALSRWLITLGFQPFSDFVPYPGRRLIILDIDRFEALPAAVQAEIRDSFSLLERSSEEVQQVNESLRQELCVDSGELDL
jgi:hypothetical protein